jgi:hypothetical protein
LRARLKQTDVTIALEQVFDQREGSAARIDIKALGRALRQPPSRWLFSHQTKWNKN